MKVIEVKFKVVTPLFIGGALKQPELRTQSFNGLFRYWFRLAGGLIEDEKRIFGWGGERAKKGVIKISVISDKVITEIFQKEFNQQGYILQGSGINYSGFSLDTRFRQDRPGEQREYIKEEQTFSLKILPQPNASCDDVKKFLCALWLSFNLGNFGSRSRRGFGSLIIESVEGELPDKFTLSFKPSLEALSNWIKENLKIIKSTINGNPRKDIPYLFDNNSFKIWKIEKDNINRMAKWLEKVQKDRNGKYLVNKWIKENISNPLDLLDYMGFLLMAYRSYYMPDYQNSKDVISGNLKKHNIEIHRVSFGLPLQFFFSSLRKGGIIEPWLNNEKLRRASPLILKILSNSFNCEGLFIVMKSKFLPENAKLRLSGENVKIPDFKIIDDFLNSLENEKMIVKIYP